VHFSSEINFPKMANEKYFSIDEVNLHKYPDDIWLIKDGKVFE